MYFYTISNGAYSDYSYTTVYHEKKFTNKEFVQMYNEAVIKRGGSCHYHDEVAEKMVELFGFKIIDQEFEVCREYDKHEPIPIEDVSEDVTYYSSDRW